jgi:hypothetical protein
MSELRENKDEVPFNGEFTPLTNRVETLGGAPDKFFRKLYVSESEVIFGTEDPFRVAQEHKALVNELKDKYGINVPSVDYVLGKDEEGREVIFQAVDKIKGKNLSDLRLDQKIPDSINFDEFFASLTEYFIDKIESGEPFFFDIARNDQFMIGTTEKDPHAKIYLVDMDEVTKIEDPIQKKINLLGSLADVAEMMWENEGKIESEPDNIKFQRAKERIIDVFANLDLHTDDGKLKDFYEKLINEQSFSDLKDDVEKKLKK